MRPIQHWATFRKVASFTHEYRQIFRAFYGNSRDPVRRVGSHFQTAHVEPRCNGLSLETQAALRITLLERTLIPLAPTRPCSGAALGFGNLVSLAYVARKIRYRMIDSSRMWNPSTTGAVISSAMMNSRPKFIRSMTQSMQSVPSIQYTCFQLIGHTSFRQAHARFSCPHVELVITRHFTIRRFGKPQYPCTRACLTRTV